MPCHFFFLHSQPVLWNFPVPLKSLAGFCPSNGWCSIFKPNSSFPLRSWVVRNHNAGFWTHQRPLRIHQGPIETHKGPMGTQRGKILNPHDQNGPNLWFGAGFGPGLKKWIQTWTWDPLLGPGRNILIPNLNLGPTLSLAQIFGAKMCGSKNFGIQNLWIQKFWMQNFWNQNFWKQRLWI